MSVITTVSKKLEMHWQSASGEDIALSLNDPRDEVDGETVSAGRETIIAQNVLQDGDGNNAEAAVTASVIETTVNETLLF